MVGLSPRRGRATGRGGSPVTATDPLQVHLQRRGLCGAISPDRLRGCAWPAGHEPVDVHGWDTEGRMGVAVRQTIESVEATAASQAAEPMAADRPIIVTPNRSGSAASEILGRS